MRTFGRATFRKCLLLALASTVAACGGDGRDSDSGLSDGASPGPQTGVILPPPDDSFDDDVITATLSGSVGDGPVVGAALAFYDHEGADIASFSSGDTADYRLSLRLKPEQFPLTIEAWGGTDLVSGVEPDFALLTVVVESGKQLTANLNPFSTLIVQTARNMRGGPSLNNIASARTSVLQHFGFGLDRRIIPDPLQTPIGDENVSVMVKASEAAGETVRRSRDALLGTGVQSAEDIVQALAADLVDGAVDGRGAPGSDARVAAVATVASAQVLVESLKNELRVGGVSASSAMDNAIAAIRPAVPPHARTASVPNTRQVLLQTALAVSAANAIAPDPVLGNAATRIAELAVDSLPGTARDRIPAGTEKALQRALERVAYADEAALESVNARSRAGWKAPAAPPGPIATYRLSAAVVELDEGEPVRFRVTRDLDAGEEYVVWRTRDRSATGGDDYHDAGTRTVQFRPGDLSREIEIETHGDGEAEAVEVFEVLLLETLGGGRLAGPTALTVRLRDVSAPPPIIDPPPPPPPAYVAPTLEKATVSGEYYQLAWRHPLEGLDGGFDILVDGTAADTRFRTNGLTARVGPLDPTVARCFQVVARYVRDDRFPRSNTLCVDAAPPPVANRAPRISGRPETTAVVGQPWSFTPVATDPDSDPLNFKVDNQPAWAAFDPATGRLSGTPGPEHQGAHAGVVISVSDGEASAALAAFTVEVRAPAERTHSITLAWTPPTTRTDGSSLDGLAGYRIYKGASPAELKLAATVDNPGLSSFVLEGLAAGPWTFAITATDLLGQESRFSNIVSTVID